MGIADMRNQQGAGGGHRVTRRTRDLNEPVEAAAEVNEAPTDANYDPAEHSIAEVKTYVGEHPEQLKQIRTREKRGSKRKGLVTFLDRAVKQAEDAEQKQE